MEILLSILFYVFLYIMFGATLFSFVWVPLNVFDIGTDYVKSSKKGDNSDMWFPVLFWPICLLGFIFIWLPVYFCKNISKNIFNIDVSEEETIKNDGEEIGDKEENKTIL